MNFGELKTFVTDILGRTDIPAAAYIVAQNDWNQKLNLQEEQVTTVLASPYTLPANFYSIVKATYGDNILLENYSISAGAMVFDPVRTDAVTVLFIANETELVNASETTTVLDKYEQVAIYGVLYHTCTMLRDNEGVQAFGPIYMAAIDQAKKSDTKARFYGRPLAVSTRESA